jgi:hypothetical protein
MNSATVDQLNSSLEIRSQVRQNMPATAAPYNPDMIHTEAILEKGFWPIV